MLDQTLRPIREKRLQLSKDMDYIKQVALTGTQKVQQIAEQTMREVKQVMYLDY